MRRPSLLQAAILAGAGLIGQAAMGQVYEYCPPEDPYSHSTPGESCPPLAAPSPYEDYGTPQDSPAMGDGQPGLPDQSAPPSLDDFPLNPGMSPGMMPGMNSGMAPGMSNQPVQQQFAPSMSPGGNSLAASTSPQSVAPNMIGDFFGVSGAGQRSVLSITTDSFHFADSFRNRTTGELVQFQASQPQLGGFIQLTNPRNLELIGDAVAPIPAGTVWNSANAQPPLPPSFALDENLVETTATRAAFPNATGVSFVSGEATQNPMHADEYSIFTDYVIQQERTMTIVIPDPGAAPGAHVGRQKIAENTSPLPRTRAFVNYSYFNSTPLSQSGVDVSRVTPGFEYAFYDDNLSIEVRTPFASTLDSDVNFGGTTSTSEIEFGNVTAYLKALMVESDTLSWSLGVGMTLPTADDVNYEIDGVTALRIENEAFHLLPFVGFLWTPRERLFVQGFAQLDIDTNGNPVQFSTFNEGIPTGNLRRIGSADDSTYAFIDLGIGYWMYRNRHADGLINGLAPTVELHYNAATEGTDTVNRNDFAGMGANVQISNPGDLEVTNVVLGLNALVGESATLTLGYAAPVSGDDQFEGEFRAFFNWYFGPSGY